MTTTVFPYPIGKQQTLILPTVAYLARTSFPDPRLPAINESQIDLVIDKLNFESTGSGDGFLSRFGCRRFSDASQVATTVDHLLGGDLRQGPPFKAKQRWKWQLLLNEIQATKLMDMFLIQKEQNRPIIIHDERIIMKESSPRTRAKVGTAPTAPYTSSGIEYYWMRSFVELIAEGDWLVPWDLNQPAGARTYKASFEGKEQYTPRMVATRDDL